jgi:hypothetical protein
LLNILTLIQNFIIGLILNIHLRLIIVNLVLQSVFNHFKFLIYLFFESFEFLVLFIGSIPLLIKCHSLLINTLRFFLSRWLF